MTTVTSATIDTPFGPVGLAASEEALVGVSLGRAFEGSGVHAHLARALGGLSVQPVADPAGAASRLRRFLAGDLAALGEQPVALHGTAFQCEVWEALRHIPAGATRTYAQIAAAIGRPAAVRAVGAANGANPVSLFVPCHRVIAADGTLWGYGGGLAAKAWLLRHEGALPPDLIADAERT